MTMYICTEGYVFPLTGMTEDADGLTTETGARLWRDRYGWDWVAVEASGDEDAQEQADAWDADAHPAITEMTLFAAGYRAGAMNLL